MKTFILPVLAVLSLSGAASIEELDEDEIRRYQHYLEFPLDLNHASESRLRASGLLTELQLSSLLRERRARGDILSFTELSLLSGFSDEAVEALRHFTSLRSMRPPGRESRFAVHGDATLKASLRLDENEKPALAYGGRIELALGESAEFRWATRTTYTESRLTPGTISAAYYSSRRPWKVVAGDFSARFGQGLLQWSGLSLDSPGSASSVIRNASGIAATSSVSSTLCGAAGDCSFGRWHVSGGISAKGGLTLLGNLAYTGETASFSLNGNSRGGSFDWRISVPDASIYGEAAWRGGPAAVAGILWVPSYGKKLITRLQYYGPAYGNGPSGLAACWNGAWLNAGIETGWSFAKKQFQTKAMMQFRHDFKAGQCVIAPSLRATCRYNQAETLHSGLRAELGCSVGAFSSTLRHERVWCKGASWLSYAEAIFNGKVFRAQLRYTIFCVDNWDDRIYAYERDIPWSFSVPAYYGRGQSVSLYAGCKLRHNAVYLRSSLQNYPWNAVAKPCRAEFKIQWEYGF